MPIELNAAALRAVLPRAPQDVLDAFAAKQDVLTKAGINQTRNRLNYMFANVEHECNGFTIPGLIENIKYSAQRMHEVWPNRFSSAAAVVAKYGSTPGWQLKAFDDIYGNRMGNRPGTDDGSRHIGRGGPQWTGRDGFEALARILKDLIPELGEVTIEQAVIYATEHKMQPEVCVAFWIWKGLNKYADTGNFNGCVKVWNGGTNGLADRIALMAGNDPILKRLASVEAIAPVTRALPGGPDTPTPPKDVIDAATKNEQAVRNAVIVGGAAAGVNETAKQTQVPANVPLVSSAVAYSAIGIAIAVAIIATLLIARKKAAIAANWF